MDEHSISVKPLITTIIGFIIGMAGRFTVDDFSKLCTGFAALVAGGYGLWKWYADYRRNKREESAAQNKQERRS